MTGTYTRERGFPYEIYSTCFITLEHLDVSIIKTLATKQ